MQNLLIKKLSLKTKPQKRLNISLLNILQKITNISILVIAYRENYKPINIYFTKFQLILINL